jgi:acetoin utilization deacetylase AcuC-like enzyme
MLTIFHSPKCLEYETRGHPESPQRIRWALEALKPHKQIEWRQPTPCSDEDIVRVHSEEHLLAVKTGSFFDADTPADPAMYEHARLAAGAAVGAADCAASGRAAFSLMRPPGHHAERNRVMGFCYFNNIAVAVAKLLERVGQSSSLSNSAVQQSKMKTRPTIAILDFDCHHGNGTEDIFRGDDRVLFVSATS